jgi:phosphatidate cytidylyltransferase
VKPIVGPSPLSAKSSDLKSSDTPKKFDPKRVYSALVFVPLFYLLTRHLPPIFFFILITLVSGLAMWEFYGLTFKEEHGRQPTLIGMLCGALLLISLQWPSLLGFQTALMTILGILIAYQVGMAPSPAFGNIPMLLFGAFYICFTFGHFLPIRALPDGPLLIFFVLLVSWGGDAAAYFVGRSMGSRPLARVLSPKKTIEGLVGGLVGAILIALLARAWFLPIITVIDCVVLGIALTLLGTIGDLSESAFKRQAGAKDSGNLIPGHGGFLDRIDSLLLTVPTFYYYMVIIKGSTVIL